MTAAASLCDVRVAPTRRDETLSMTLTYSATAAAARGAVVASPLPFLGGDMDNNVVRALARAVALHGLPALRFDYRSVGASHDRAPEESRFETWRRVEASGDRTGIAADAAEALRRASRLFTPALLAGYSFGCWTAAHAASLLAAPLPLVLVAPPLARIDLPRVATHGAPVLLVFAGDDALAPTPTAEELRVRFPLAHVHVLVGADHFLRGREEELVALVAEFLRGALPTTTAENLRGARDVLPPPGPVRAAPTDRAGRRTGLDGAGAHPREVLA